MAQDNAKVTVACGTCGTPVNEEPNTAEEKRQPCPVCGSRTRLYSVHAQDNLVIRDQNLRDPVAVPGVRTQPSLVLYQRPFLLSEVEFHQLRTPVSVLMAGGMVVLGITVAFVLQRLVPLLHARLGGPAYAVPTSDVRVAIILAVVTLGLLILGRTMAPEKRALMGRIAKHFRDNPARPEIRVED